MGKSNRHYSFSKYAYYLLYVNKRVVCLPPALTYTTLVGTEWKSWNEIIKNSLYKMEQWTETPSWKTLAVKYLFNDRSQREARITFHLNNRCTAKIIWQGKLKNCARAEFNSINALQTSSEKQHNTLESFSSFEMKMQKTLHTVWKPVCFT